MTEAMRADNGTNSPASENINCPYLPSFLQGHNGFGRTVLLCYPRNISISNIAGFIRFIKQLLILCNYFTFSIIHPTTTADYSSRLCRLFCSYMLLILLYFYIIYRYHESKSLSGNSCIFRVKCMENLFCSKVNVLDENQVRRIMMTI